MCYELEKAGRKLWLIGKGLLIERGCLISGREK
jgi:hypothetical protein